VQAAFPMAQPMRCQQHHSDLMLANLTARSYLRTFFLMISPYSLALV
jgi:hypothetical protein